MRKILFAVSTVGEEFSKELYPSLEKTWLRTNQNFRGIERAKFFIETVFLGEFWLQVRTKNSPIRGDEIVPSLLSDPMEKLKNALTYLGRTDPNKLASTIADMLLFIRIKKVTANEVTDLRKKNDMMLAF